MSTNLFQAITLYIAYILVEKFVLRVVSPYRVHCCSFKVYRKKHFKDLVTTVIKTGTSKALGDV